MYRRASRAVRQFIILLLTVAVVMQPLCLYAADKDEEKIPQTTAALVQHYEARTGTFELTGKSRIFVVSDGEEADGLMDTVELMSREIAESGLAGEKAPAVVYGRKSRAKSGDIVIELTDNIDFSYGGDMADDEEAYSLEIGAKAQLTACGTDGVFYGLVTLLELAAESDAKGGAVLINKCKIYDGPDVAERTIFLDCGRKYFSRMWIENFIRRSAMQRYNAIQLHFTEEQGIRLESEAFPWLTDGQKALSREDMSEIVAYAGKYHMEVIPSVDTPGHNEYMVAKYASYVKKHPDWSFEYDGKTYSSKTKGFSSIANYYSCNGEKKKVNYVGVDITKKHAVAFVDALIDDYASFFAELGCTKFAIGGDEVFGWYEFTLGGKSFGYKNRWDAFQHWAKYAKKSLGIEKGSSQDTFINYMNHVAELVEAKGYTCRMFNDEIYISKKQHVDLKESIEIQFWSPAAGNYRKLVGQNRKIYMDIPKWSYYVVKSSEGADIMSNRYRAVNAENIFRNWKPGQITLGKKAYTLPADQFGGAVFNIWCDQPSYKSSTKIWEETRMRTWSSGSRMWNKEINSGNSGSERKLKYDELKRSAKKFSSVMSFNINPEKTIELAETGEPEKALGFLEKLFGAE